MTIRDLSHKFCLLQRFFKEKIDLGSRLWRKGCEVKQDVFEAATGHFKELLTVSSVGPVLWIDDSGVSNRQILASKNRAADKMAQSLSVSSCKVTVSWRGRKDPSCNTR